MRPEDVPVVERLSAESFYELDVRTFPPHWPAPVLRPPERADNWNARAAHLLGTDPGGCWVAEDATGVVGVAVSFRRELLWCLATYAVVPELQGRGIGRPLLEAALSHSQGCLRGMLSASTDPRALRRYAAAGFSMHPQMWLTGRVDRSTVPVIEKVREGSAADIELMDSVDRRTRGAAHGAPDHLLMLSAMRLLVSDTTTGSGYAYVAPDGAPALLAASNRRTAARLLWAVLADSQGTITVNHLTAANDWAVHVGLAARLDLFQGGFLAVRGMKPPSPYVHHGALL